MSQLLPLDLLVCPQDHSPLRLADAALIARVNEAIAVGVATNVAGRKIEKPIEAGLVRDGGGVLYPIIDEIPVLIIEEAIAIQ